MSSGLDRLPTKLGAAVKEYLRQRESGALHGHWTISLQLAKLLRGAHLSGDEGVIKATKEVLSEMDAECSMLVGSIANRMAGGAKECSGSTSTSTTNSTNSTSLVNSTVEKIRLAPTELQSEILGYDQNNNNNNVKTTMVIDGDHEILLDEDDDSTVQVMKRDDLCDVTSILEKSAISKCVIMSTGIHCAQGIAVCPGGSRALARAARRLGIPVIVAAARFSFVYADEDGMDLPKRKRAHPGVAHNIDTDIEVVRYVNDHLPIEEVSLIMTEQGGYHPKYAKTLSSTD